MRGGCRAEEGVGLVVGASACVEQVLVMPATRWPDCEMVRW